MSLIYQVASNAKILSDQWKTCCFEVLNCLNFIAVYLQTQQKMTTANVGRQLNSSQLRYETGKLFVV